MNTAEIDAWTWLLRTLAIAILYTTGLAVAHTFLLIERGVDIELYGKKHTVISKKQIWTTIAKLSFWPLYLLYIAVMLIRFSFKKI